MFIPPRFRIPFYKIGGRAGFAHSTIGNIRARPAQYQKRVVYMFSARRMVPSHLAKLGFRSTMFL